MKAAWTGDLAQVQALLEQGADTAITNQGDTAYSLAVTAEHDSIACTLKNRAGQSDLNGKLQEQLLNPDGLLLKCKAAILDQDCDAVTSILQEVAAPIYAPAWASPTQSGHAVLCALAHMCDTHPSWHAFSKLLASTEACSAECPKTMKTALSCAVSCFPDDQLRDFSMLDASSANHKGAGGDALLHTLVRAGRLNAVSALLNVSGLDMHAKGSSLQTALECAAVAGDTELVEVLLQACGRPGSREGAWSFGAIAAAASAAERAGHGKVSQQILYG